MPLFRIVSGAISSELALPFFYLFYRVSQYQNVSILDFIGAKSDGGGGNNWSYRMCKAPGKMSPSTNQHPVFFTGWMPFLSSNHSVLRKEIPRLLPEHIRRCILESFKCNKYVFMQIFSRLLLLSSPYIHFWLINALQNIQNRYTKTYISVTNNCLFVCLGVTALTAQIFYLAP